MNFMFVSAAILLEGCFKK